MIRAALYARYSTDKQSEDSIVDQLRVCEQLCAREGFEVVARFSDAAISGGTANRPGYQELLTAARSRVFDVIVAEDSSRLWRELSEQWRALKELLDLNIHVVGHGIDTRRDESKLLLSVTGAAAEAYRDEISRRTRRGLEGRARAARPTGGRAYGYVSSKDSPSGHMEVHATQAETVRAIFQWFADGKSPRWIAGELNRLKVPSPGAAWQRTTRRRDGKWVVSAIHGVASKGTGILNNEKYIGRMTWGRLKWQRGAADSSRRIPARATTELVVHIDERLRIVPQELWERVKRRQLAVARTYAASQGSHRPKAHRPAAHLLSGEIKCPECAGSFSVVSARKYGCTTHHNGGPAACRFDLKLSRHDTEEAVLELLQRELLSPEAVRVFMAGYQAELARARRQSRREGKPAKASTAAIAKYDAAIATLRAQLKAGTLPEEVALDAIAATERRRQAAQQATEAKAERQGAEVVHMLPATAETLSRSLELAVRDRDFLRPDEIAEAKIGLRELLGGTPMRIERLADGRVGLRVRISPQALLIAASGGVDNVVAGACYTMFRSPSESV